jgi:glucose 1-dehydrogenase
LRAICVTPGRANSIVLKTVEAPKPSPREILLDVQKVGICGTDRDIIAGFYGQAPEGQDYLILGHESLSRVADTGSAVRGFRKGDLVVPTVRRNCFENCLNCRSGESDMCLTGDYKEHGIKQLNGFAADRAVTDSAFVVKLPNSLSDLGVLLEPLTVVEKGKLQTYLLQQSRMKWKPRRALVLGAGPVGILGTAILRLKGLEVDAVATRSDESLKARLIEQTGAKYINAKEKPLNSLGKKYDIVFEVTGNPAIALEAQELIEVNGVVCYLGIYKMQVDSEDAGNIFTDLVLGNKVHFGSVNANKTYFAMGVKDLIAINRRWPGLLAKMITRRETPENYEKAYSPESEEEIKTIVEFKK